MALCSKCGSSIADGVAFCPNCGAPTSSTVEPPIPTPAPVSGPAVMPSAVPTGISENLAGLLCYLLGWVTGIVFLFIDRRPLVRFHAAQSIVVFGGLFILHIVFSWGLLGWHNFGLFPLWAMLSLLVSVLAVIAWLVLMVATYQGRKIEVPIAADIAKTIAGNPRI